MNAAQVYTLVIISIGALATVISLILKYTSYWRGKGVEREREGGDRKLIVPPNMVKGSLRGKAAAKPGMILPRWVTFIVSGGLVAFIILFILGVIYKNNGFLLSAILLAIVQILCLWVVDEAPANKVKSAAFIVVIALGISAVPLYTVIPAIEHTQGKIISNLGQIVSSEQRNVKTAESIVDNSRGTLRILSKRTKNISEMSKEISGITNTMAMMTKDMSEMTLVIQRLQKQVHLLEGKNEKRKQIKGGGK